MSFTFLNQLPTPEEIKRDYPLTPELAELKKQRDAMISDVITGKDSRFLVIIGPCSADNEDSVCDYVSRLTKIQEDVKDQLIIIPRVYTNKPRTTGEGYKGIASQPDPEKAPNMVEGLIAMRKMHIRAIAESGLTCADEMLYPENWGYVEDLLSYVAIGARSVEDQQHRLTVSGFDVASGMKNPTSGDFSVMLNTVYFITTLLILFCDFIASLTCITYQINWHILRNLSLMLRKILPINILCLWISFFGKILLTSQINNQFLTFFCH